MDRDVPAGGEDDVSRQGRLVRCQAPHMEMMDTVNARLRRDRTRYLLWVEAPRNRFQEDVEGVAEETPGRPEDKGGDDDGDGRVGSMKTPSQNQGTGHH